MRTPPRGNRNVTIDASPPLHPNRYVVGYITAADWHHNCVIRNRYVTAVTYQPFNSYITIVTRIHHSRRMTSQLSHHNRFITKTVTPKQLHHNGYITTVIPQPLHPNRYKAGTIGCPYTSRNSTRIYSPANRVYEMASQPTQHSFPGQPIRASAVQLHLRELL